MSSLIVVLNLLICLFETRPRYASQAGFELEILCLGLQALRRQLCTSYPAVHRLEIPSEEGMMVPPFLGQVLVRRMLISHMLRLPSSKAPCYMLKSSTIPGSMRIVTTLTSYFLWVVYRCTNDAGFVNHVRWGVS